MSILKAADERRIAKGRKISEWQDGRTKPKYPGVYQRKLEFGVVWARWNGKHWCCWSVEYSGASNWKSEYTSPSISWRGVIA